MSENFTGGGDQAADPKGPGQQGSLQSTLQWGRLALGRIGGWLPGYGLIWRSGVVVSIVTAAAVFGGRGGFFFASKMEVLPFPESGPLPAGVVYFLPRAVINIDATFQITRCNITRPADGGELNVDFDATASADI